MPKQGEEGRSGTVTRDCNSLGKSEVKSAGQDVDQTQAHLQHGSGQNQGQQLQLKCMSKAGGGPAQSFLCLSCTAFVPAAWSQLRQLHQQYRQQAPQWGQRLRLNWPAGQEGHVFCRVLSNGECMLFFKEITVCLRPSDNQDFRKYILQPCHDVFCRVSLRW